MNNSQSNSQGQRWLDNMMEAIPKSEEGMVKEASTIADMMKSPELVFFKHRFPQKKPEEALVIEDSDEEGNAGTANAGSSNEDTSNGHTGNNYIGNNDNGNADVKQDEPENEVEIKIEYEDELSETNHRPRIFKQTGTAATNVQNAVILWKTSFNWNNIIAYTLAKNHFSANCARESSLKSSIASAIYEHMMIDSNSVAHSVMPSLY